MCQYSNNLYNVALYNIRQYSFQEKKFLKYEENYHICTVAGWRVTTTLIKKAKSGAASKTSKSLTIGKRAYQRHKHQRHVLDRSSESGAARWHAGLEGKTSKEVRICPIIQYCYLQEEEPQDLFKNNVPAIDIGPENLATCVTNTGTGFTWAGVNSNLSTSIGTNRGRRKRTGSLPWHTQDYIRVGRCIINYCIEYRIGTIVCGYKRDFKRSRDLSSRKSVSGTYGKH